MVTFSATGTDLDTWHCRFGHPHVCKPKMMQNSSLYDGGIPCTSTPGKQLSSCEHCAYAKHHAATFPKRAATRAIDILQLVHSNICGPVSVLLLGGGRYFLIFINDYSCYSWIYILKHKHEAFDIFKDFLSMSERQTDLYLQG